MLTLQSLKNTHTYRKNVQRVGRGIGSKRGKTSCRGVKGDKSRSGYKRHYGREGGQLPLYRRLPCRGFANGMFRTEVCSVNLAVLDKLYQDGEVVNLETLQQKGYAPRRAPGGIKVLGNGELKKKVTIHANGISASAKDKLDKQGIAYSII